MHTMYSHFITVHQNVCHYGRYFAVKGLQERHIVVLVLQLSPRYVSLVGFALLLRYRRTYTPLDNLPFGIV